MARLGAAYGTHQARRIVGLRGRSDGLARALAIYEPEGLLPLTPEERDLLPAMSRCINCGICALVAGRLGSAYLPDLSSAYLRPLPRLRDAAGDLGEPSATDLDAAAAACPVGVPLPAVAAIVRRLAGA